jgi:hypothetical protein
VLLFCPLQVADFSKTGKGAQTIAQIARMMTDIDIFLTNRYSSLVHTTTAHELACGASNWVGKQAHHEIS